MRKISILFFALFLSFAINAQDTKPPYWNEVQAFKKMDSAFFPEKGQILFVGSSSFTMWKDVQDYFPGYKILNRGFGGSSLTDVIYYAGDVILKYQPKQIVIYCGENDFAGNDSLYPAQVAERFFTLFKIIREQYKNVPVAYISMKPSPSRQHLMAKFNVANVMIKEFLRKKKRTAFVDVYHAMLKDDGTPMEDIFLEDKLHMNKKGYAIWQQLVQPHLIK
jgi:lysophospholipase L1-like esterase